MKKNLEKIIFSKSLCEEITEIEKNKDKFTIYIINHLAKLFYTK